MIASLNAFETVIGKIEFYSAISEIYSSRNRPSDSMTSILGEQVSPVTSLLKVMFYLAPALPLPVQ